jgi:hypothetical protein
MQVFFYNQVEKAFRKYSDATEAADYLAMLAYKLRDELDGADTLAYIDESAELISVEYECFEERLCNAYTRKRDIGFIEFTTIFRMWDNPNGMDYLVYEFIWENYLGISITICGLKYYSDIPEFTPVGPWGVRHYEVFITREMIGDRNINALESILTSAAIHLSEEEAIHTWNYLKNYGDEAINTTLKMLY